MEGCIKHPRILFVMTVSTVHYVLEHVSQGPRSSTEIMFQSRRTLMPCNNWRNTSFNMTLTDCSPVKPVTSNYEVFKTTTNRRQQNKSVCACAQGMRPAIKKTGTACYKRAWAQALAVKNCMENCTNPLDNRQL